MTEYRPDTGNLTAELNRLARFYKVSTLVVLRRLYETNQMNSAQYREAYDEELDRIKALAANKADGGDFYNTTPVRVSKTFARALISETQEGRTLYHDAARMLGSKKISAFVGLAERLGVA